MKLLLAITAFVATASAGHAITPGDRFAAEISVFAKQNSLPDEPAGGTLFLGSSSVRLWTRVGRLPIADGINRGFGGATTLDLLRNYETLIGDFEPATVIVYIGENDIADGRAPQLVADDVQTLLARVRADFPRARIAYLSAKPSPARAPIWHKMMALNRLISARAGRSGAFDFIDVATSLLAADGTPDAACFSADGLHMNPSGYGRWNEIVTRYLDPRARAGKGMNVAAKTS